MKGVGREMGKERRRRARKETEGRDRSRRPRVTEMHQSRTVLGKALQREARS